MPHVARSSVVDAQNSANSAYRAKQEIRALDAWHVRYGLRLARAAIRVIAVYQGGRHMACLSPRFPKSES